MESEKLLTVDEAAQKLGVKVPTIRTWILNRCIEFIRVGGLVKISNCEIERIIEEGRQPRSARRSAKTKAAKLSHARQ